MDYYSKIKKRNKAETYNIDETQNHYVCKKKKNTRSKAVYILYDLIYILTQGKKRQLIGRKNWFLVAWEWGGNND